MEKTRRKSHHNQKGEVRHTRSMSVSHKSFYVKCWRHILIYSLIVWNVEAYANECLAVNAISAVMTNSFVLLFHLNYPIMPPDQNGRQAFQKMDNSSSARWSTLTPRKMSVHMNETCWWPHDSRASHYDDCHIARSKLWMSSIVI